MIRALVLCLAAAPAFAGGFVQQQVFVQQQPVVVRQFVPQQVIVQQGFRSQAVIRQQRVFVQQQPVFVQQQQPTVIIQRRGLFGRLFGNDITVIR